MASFEVALSPSHASPAKGEHVTVSAKVTRTDSDPNPSKLTLVWNLGGSPISGAAEEHEFAAGDDHTFTHEFDHGKDTAGEYSVTAEVGGTAHNLAGNTTTTIAAPAADNGDGDGDAAVDPRDLVWDPAFAQATGTFIVLLAILFSVVYATWALDAIYKDITAMFAATAMWVGGLAILGGTWVVMLEMRGRAPKNADGSEPAKSKGIAAKFLDKLDPIEIGKTLRSMRGVIAVLFIGFLLFLVAWLALEDFDLGDDDDDEHGTDTTMVTDTTS